MFILGQCALRLISRVKMQRIGRVKMKYWPQNRLIFARLIFAALHSATLLLDHPSEWLPTRNGSGALPSALALVLGRVVLFRTALCSLSFCLFYDMFLFRVVPQWFHSFYLFSIFHFLKLSTLGFCISFCLFFEV